MILAPVSQKRCSVCGQHKTISGGTYRRKDGRGGLRGFICAACRTDKPKEVA
jgi:hypothetical protein